MARPRLKLTSEKIVRMFLDRRIFESQADVIDAGLRALVREQMLKEAEQQGKESIAESMVGAQLAEASGTRR